MKLEVTKTLSHGSDIRELWLMLPDGGDLPEWEAGAHIGVTIPGNRDDVTHGLKRHYSLVGNPGDAKHYRIVVLKEIDSTGGSKYIHEHVDVGQLLDVEPPKNGFPLDPDARDFVLIAGGIGITPFYSMVSTLQTLKRRFKLHVLTRSIERLPKIDGIGSLSRDQLHIHVTGDGDRPSLAGLVGLPAKARALYACGPNGLLQDIEREAIGLGWSRDNIHFESFGVRRETQEHVVTVHLSQSGITVQVTPGTSILDGLLEAGAFLSYQCGRGECGFCYSEVISGEPIHRDVCLTSSQRAIGMCPCVSWASSETLVLDL